MANTFKFGNDNWAVKDGQALAYNNENNNFKPLPFDFTRASTATRVNRQGLVEVVPSGKPRIDFLDNTKGHLLLEPSRTNKLLRSNKFNTTWTLGSALSLTSGQTSTLTGNSDSWLLSSNGTSGFSALTQAVSISGSHTYSIFAKKGTNNLISLRSLSGADARAEFNLNTGVLNSTSNTSSTEIKSYGNGWYRVSMTFSASNSFVYVYPNSIGTADAGNIYIQNSQLEAGSYATSYIPTEGSSVTRVVDDIELVLPTVDSFASSSGFSVIAKFDIGATSGSSSVPFLFFNDDSSSTYIGFGSNTTNLRCRLNLSGTSYLNTQANAPRTQRNSLFTSCDSSGWSQGANGLTNHTGTNNASIFNRLASITFITSETYGIIKISELLVYNTRLTNTELQNLTS
jgi:hypothetical protein